MPLETPDIVFQELTEPELLRESMALRFSNYRETKGLCLMESLDTASGLDVDEFDTRSRHFGLVARTGDRARLMGSVRLIQESPSPHAASVFAAVAEAPTARARLAPRLHTPLSLVHYTEAREDVLALIEQAHARDEHVIEASRLVFSRECRGFGLSGIKSLAEFVVLGCTAVQDRMTRVSNALVQCRAHHGAFYRSVGFRPLRGRSFVTEPKLGLSMNVFHRRPEWTSDEVRATCGRLADAVERVGLARFGDFVPDADRVRGRLSVEVAA
ncbi:MAG TPA: GNAT family N-acyltransferase [Candidatus Saccharimonadaceae bacterium]|jgi:hypothetical protein|nr:GNAT family N-acyltransferase [Candidatus Saccharimonadaceae bacterium]